MSGNPTSNVVPMPGSWPSSPPWPSTAVPPGCFSELARLNQCYNEVQMMEMILSKVVCDLAQNNVAFQQCLVEAIAKSGSNVPLIGVTNGADAQPGQVGEYFFFHSTPTFSGTASQSQNVVVGTLNPGDWQCWAAFHAAGYINGVIMNLNPQPTGFTTPMFGSTNIATPTGSEGDVNFSITSRALISVQTLVNFNLTTNYAGGGTGTTTGDFYFQARRMR